jgi:membrane-associated protease RseP (regulator of RpoE activity)
MENANSSKMPTEQAVCPCVGNNRHRYQMLPNLHGVYVLAVAAREGIRPGDVLATVRHEPISTPADVDRIVWAALAMSVTDFLFGVNWGPDVVDVNTNISVPIGTISH